MNIAQRKTMKIATWNVNSVRARLEHAQSWLKDVQPDILMFQELKGLDFPADVFAELGYKSEAVTQKAYNGVAILSKHDIKLINTALPGGENDDHARYLECDIAGVRVINIYAPNGNPIGTEKFTYKIAWLERLYARIRTLNDEGVQMAIGGDYNIIPEDIDCYNPSSWTGDALFQPESRAAYRKMKNLGMVDAFRALDPRPGAYSYWDYFGGAWEGNRGIRIDHFLISPEIADRMTACIIDRTPRGWEKPSDHTPVILEIA